MNSPHGGDGDPAADLERLIGDIREESARTRATPDFPFDSELTIGAELDRLAPAPSKPRLERLADVMEALGRSRPARAQTPSGRVRRLAQGGRPYGRRSGAQDPGDERLDQIVPAVAAALRDASARLGELEARVGGLERRGHSTSGSGEPRLPAPDPSGGASLVHWIDEVASGTAGSDGRVLFVGEEAERWIDVLRRAGVDVYAVDPGVSDVAEFAAVRGGDLQEHLRLVGDQTLARVVVLAPATRVSRPDVGDVAAQLARTALGVTIISEAAWAWAQRLGPVEADLSGSRPLQVETWIATLDWAGFDATARFAADGRSFLVEGTRRRE